MKTKLTMMLALAALPLLGSPLQSEPTRVIVSVADAPEVTATPIAVGDRAHPPVELDTIPIAFLVDVGSGQVLYSKEPDRRFLPASITKVMTLYTAFDLLKAGRIKPEQPMVMSPEAYRKWHNVGTSLELDLTKQANVETLVLAIANISANDASVVLGEGAAGTVDNWITLMNANARRLGMTNSHFGTPNGWMDQGETYVTARDLVTLATAMVSAHPDLYDHYIGHASLKWDDRMKRNHDPLIGKLRGADGIKTGFTNQAGFGYLGSAERDGRRLVMVVAGVDRGKERDKAAAALMEWGFSAFSNRPIFAPGSRVGEARVQGGENLTVPLVAPAAFGITLPRDAGGDVHVRIDYDGPIQAPVKKGSMIAALEIVTGKGEPHRVPLFAGTDVAPAGWLARLRNGIVSPLL
ncbi:D-alanyl-D-alanine carboxypeptidase family protein [Novosphingobium aquae]|uniref:serine-type D-Ala-D-Ala carboxypeptidase n=1 Tax=Novosphingobium aquae TaxID=3133435 RepID=A0ABU8S509_9SPHN